MKFDIDKIINFIHTYFESKYGGLMFVAVKEYISCTRGRFAVIIYYNFLRKEVVSNGKR